MATTTDPQSQALHAADSHDLIRVHGARVNNLKDVSVEIPKRRLTVFTGVSGSGKSSLVFGTIAAESQRLINETYSAFVQGFMPTLARPDVDVLDGLTTAIIVDQERMGADPRSTVGTATDANAMLRILFSRLGEPHIGPPQRVRLQRPLRQGQRRASRSSAATRRRTVKATFSRTGGMCPRCEGRGAVTDFDLSALYDDSKSLNEGALTIPGYSMEGWYGRIFRGVRLLRPGQADREVQQARAPRPAPQGADEGQGRGHQPHVLGADPADPEVVPVQGRRRDAAAHPRVRRAGGRRSPPARSATARGSTEGARASKIGGINIADACAMQISDLAGWVARAGRAVRRAAARLARAHARLVRRDRARLPQPRPAVGHAVGRRGAADEDGPPPRLVAHRRHLRLRRADDRPAPARHPADERAAAAAARQGQHRARRRAQARDDRHRRPRRRPRAPRGHRGRRGHVRGHGRRAAGAAGTITGRHLDDRALAEAAVRERTGALEVRGAGTHNLQDVDVDIPLGVLVRRHGRRGLGQELAHPRLGRRPRRRRRRSTRRRSSGSRRSNPATYTGLLDPIRKAFAKANGVKPGAVQRELRGRLPDLQRRRRHLHRPGDDGRRRDAVRGVRGQALPGRGARVHARRQGHQRGARDAGRRGRGVLRRRRGADARRPQDPRAARGRRARLPDARPAAHDAVRRRAPAPEARDPHGGEGRRLRPRRADHGPAPRRRRAAARPARPARRRRASR